MVGSTAGPGSGPGQTTGAPGPYTTGSGTMNYQHSPIPGNPTPPLTPQHPGSMPYASPGGGDVKPTLPIQSKMCDNCSHETFIFWA